MRWVGKLGLNGWVWRAAAALALVVGLAATQAASAQTGATIIVFAPGAPQGAPVSVEWLDPTTGAWRTVDGWTGTLDQMTATGVPFKAWAVLPANFGQGPFRWVIGMAGSNNLANNGNMAGNNATSSTMGMGNANNTSTTGTANGLAGSQNGAASMAMTENSAWGTSSPFNLPAGAGANLEITVFPAAMLTAMSNITGSGAANTNTATTGTGTTASATTTTTCGTGTCNAASIRATFTGLPATSWITIEWLDGNGNWQPVMGWQGTADSMDASGALTKQFGVYRQNYGQGPFRWAVYSAPTGGTLLAVSPTFNLPTADGQATTMDLVK